MKANATILYYTSNKEDPAFEARVRETILKNSGGLPIVSVSHEPIEFGHNIYVGNVGVSGFNMFRQVQIGLEIIKTTFVISAEADCLYPPDYFTFRPPDVTTCYRTSNLYVMPDKRSFFFFFLEGATHAQVVGTTFYAETLKNLFVNAPDWSVEEKNFPKERTRKADVFEKIAYWESKNPVFQIKTHRGMRYYTRSDRTPIMSLPYWGSGTIIRRRYLYGLE